MRDWLLMKIWSTKMKAGDLIHVPSHVTLTMDVVANTDGLTYIKTFVTKVSKKALFIQHLDNGLAVIQYGKNNWTVSIKNISLVKEA